MSFLHTFLQTYRRVEQHATRYTILVVLLLVGLFLEAYMHNFNLVYITLFFLFAAVLTAAPLGILNIGRLEAGFEGCGRLFAKRESHCRFNVKNPSPATAWGIALWCKDQSQPLSSIEPQTVIRANLPIVPKRRGRMALGPCRLESRFPLSTIRFVLPIEARCEVVVYPEPKGKPLQSYLQRIRTHYGEETDFDGLVHYSGSQSASRIHWPSVAKGETMVKHFITEHETQTLRFDFKSCAKSDEARLSQLTLWALECEKRGLPFIIRMPHGELDSRKEGIDAILETLATY
ncbi:DUF58 domain-containing protein [Hydrogenimonas cancrithermarum]|uniref:DUF58 domain-containing protein n=1 Tax=Hydrogenimonas cancrithermarum TaxID=2993563 RepID=A0ABM8FNG8_9BACT|nr:DUF58 domain-containing protein [Hydrogenimonas cancrithermarum]BDY13946.1 hypothetical protein HCR_22580 [Hydrogenimonas cancrithermarum]